MISRIKYRVRIFSKLINWLSYPMEIFTKRDISVENVDLTYLYSRFYDIV